MRIFISHASEQESQAYQITIGLRERKHKVFFSRENLQPGQAYDRTIRESIDKSDLFVFLISPSAVEKGRYTLAELKFAQERWPVPSNHVLPIIALKTPKEIIPDYLRHVTILDPQGDFKAEVLAHIDKLPRRRATRRSILLAMVIVSLLSIGAHFCKNFIPRSSDTMVNISRIADFSKLKCSSGKKVDIADLSDNYKLLDPREKFYSATAIALRGDEVAAYDEQGGRLEPQDVDSEEGRQKVSKWNLPLNEDKAFIRYRWVNAHQATREGLAFRSSYKINEINAKVMIPPGAHLRNIGFSPSAANLKCFKTKEYKEGDNPVYDFQCGSLMIGDEVRIWWDWDVWKDCEK